MKKNKFEYKRVDDRIKVEDFPKIIDKITIDDWEIIYYF